MRRNGPVVRQRSEGKVARLASWRRATVAACLLLLPTDRQSTHECLDKTRSPLPGGLYGTRLHALLQHGVGQLLAPVADLALRLAGIAA